MKKLSVNQMEQINGGNVIDVACGVVGFADIGATIAVKLGATLVPGAGWFLLGASIACAIYEMP